jgi:hypothetical protein
MKTHVRPDAVPCVKREPSSLSSLILRCSLLLRLAGRCILRRGIDTVEVWGSSPHEPTTSSTLEMPMASTILLWNWLKVKACTRDCASPVTSPQSSRHCSSGSARLGCSSRQRNHPSRSCWLPQDLSEWRCGVYPFIKHRRFRDPIFEALDDCLLVTKFEHAVPKRAQAEQSRRKVARSRCGGATSEAAWTRIIL